MMAIPRQLQTDGYRFIPLRGKQPFQPNWQRENNYAHDDKKLQEHIKKGGNYGILCGGPQKLLVIDYDTEEAIETYLSRFPETLTVKTGSGKLHAYYHTDTPESHQVNDGDIKMDFQGTGRQVVGPGSTHPTTQKKYEIDNDTKIAFLPYEKIREVYDKHTSNQETTPENNLTLREVARELGVHLKNGLQKCVWHNDKTPSLSVDFTKNQFNCHATTCQRHGGIRKLVMYQKGLNEEDAQVWLNTYERQLYGTREGRVQEAIGEVMGNQAAKNVLSVKTLMEEGIPPITWRVLGLIPKRGLTMLGAAPGGRKTYIAQHLSLALSQGTPFLDKFETEQCKVLYIDEENGVHLLHRRYGQLSEGHDIDTFDDLYLLVYEGIKLDTKEGAATLRVLVEQYQAEYVIIDSMVRFMQGDENNASDVRNVFDNIKGLMEDRDMGFMILHHLGKDPRKGMMGLRGSSDFSGMCDVVLIMYDKAGELVMEMDKNRVVDTSQMKGMTISITHPEEDKDVAVRFTYTGVAVKKQDETLQDRARSEILKWVEKNGVREVHTKVLRPFIEQKGVSRSTFFHTIQNLVDDGVFHRKQKGVCRVDDSFFSSTKKDSPEDSPEIVQGTTVGLTEDSEIVQTVQGVSVLTPGLDWTNDLQTTMFETIRNHKNMMDRATLEREFPNAPIKKMLKEGDLYEPKPGYIGVLE